METIQFSPIILALVPIVVGLTSIAKLYMDNRFAPLVSLGLGVTFAFLTPGPTIAITVLSGVVVGLTASGLYSGAKAALGAPQA